MTADTIAAVATPFGEGAIAMLRVSGPAALEIAGRVCQPTGDEWSRLRPRRLYRATLCSPDGSALDDVLVSVHRAPASYTGEDVVEITCHGGVLVTRRALDVLLAAGARAAEPGEFTQRAFLNGKMDLTQAEAVMDLIGAQTDLALRAASEQLAGRLGRRVNGLRDDLLSLVAHVEAYIDFPDEDIDPDTGAALLARFDAALGALDTLLATAGQGRILREGVRTVIYGEPNVGKSSLLNALVGHERAIVSAIPGTTRDTVEEFINLRGLPLRLIDTAGLRDTADPVENAGIARTHDTLARADLALRLVDASQPPPSPAQTPALPGAAVAILVLNKIDLGLAPDWAASEHADAVRVSCRTGEGLDALATAVYEGVTGGQLAWNPAAAAINARHQRCLARARESLTTARGALAGRMSPEFVALDLRMALDAVGEVVGGVDTEEILGKIFFHVLPRKMTSILYRLLLRPLLFALDAETAHHAAMAALKLSCRLRFPLGLVRALAGARGNDRRLERTVFGVRFPNPVGLAAGFDKDGVALAAWEALGFGFVEAGTLTAHAQPGNPRPRLFRVPQARALINRLGFNNGGAAAAAARFDALRAAGRWPSIPVGINLGKSKATPLEMATEDYVDSLGKLHAHGDYFVLNVSSPNTPGLRTLQGRDELDALLRAVQAKNRALPSPRPMLVKIAPDLGFEQIEEVLGLAVQHGLAGIVATNTTIDHTSLPPGAPRETGGLSGGPLRARATEIVRFVAGKTTLPVIAVGGVADAAGAQEKLDAGAALVQLYTGFVYGGPTTAPEICRGLR